MEEQTRPQHQNNLHWKILIGLLVGFLVGLLVRNVWPQNAQGIVDYVAKPMGDVFLRLILMVVVPLVFSSLVLGIAGIGDPRKLGRVGVRTMLLTLILSTISVLVGLTVANVVKPGKSLTEEKRTMLAEKYESNASKAVANAEKSKAPMDTLLDIIPKNPLQEMVGALDGSSPGNGILSVMFFALLVGIAASLLPDQSKPLLDVLDSIFQICMVIIGWAMKLAPFGVAGLIFSLTVLLGPDILSALAWYVFAVLLGLAIQLFVIYSGMVFLLGKMNPVTFFSKSMEAILTAFSTSSSNATLPTALRVAEENLGVRPETARFVLTVGSTANQNGTALYEGVTVLFLAQVFGKDLSYFEQFQVLFLCVLAGVGTAGVPGGSLPAVVLVLQKIGLPGGAIGLIMGVDRLLDMSRTTLNVTGDLALAVCVDAMEPADEIADATTRQETTS